MTTRHLSLLMFCSIWLVRGFAQVPNQFNFSGTFLANGFPVTRDETVFIRSTILNNNQIIYQEEHQNVLTNRGNFTVSIGTGIPLVGEFTTIDWSKGPYYLKTELRIHPIKRFDDLGTLQFLSVPYALLAESTTSWMTQENNAVTTEKKVGLSTTEPLEALQIGDRWTFHNGGTKFISYNTYYNGTNDVRVTDDDASQVRFNSNGAIQLSSDGFNRKNTSFVPKTTLYIGPEGKIGVNTTSPEAALDVNGYTRTKVLEITGGSDISEMMESDERLEPGMVVSLKDNKLVYSSGPRDKLVIGVISGYNDVNPGLILEQKGVLEGKYPVAIAGRVYVRTMGVIKPGDHLTISKFKGIAKKAGMFSRLFNKNIIGKALTESNDNSVLIIIK